MHLIVDQMEVPRPDAAQVIHSQLRRGDEHFRGGVRFRAPKYLGLAPIGVGELQVSVTGGVLTWAAGRGDDVNHRHLADGAVLRQGILVAEVGEVARAKAPGEDSDAPEAHMGVCQVQVQPPGNPLDEADADELAQTFPEGVVVVVVEEGPQTSGAERRKLPAWAEDQDANGFLQVHLDVFASAFRKEYHNVT
ncbi:MAG: hypothetical protein OXJ53_09340 [Gammaproteobacteria bacterium]|nr:hypothetical protein [Gammaproteobacteria bacterium]